MLEYLKNLLLKMDKWERSKYQQIINNSKELQNLLAKGEGSRQDFMRFSGDIFGSLYQFDPKMKDPTDSKASPWKPTYDEMVKLPEYEALHQETMGRSWESGLGVEVIADRLIKDDRLPDKPEQQKSMNDAEKGRLRQSLRKACKKAEQEIGETKAAMSAFDYSPHGLGNGQENDGELLKLAKSLMKNKELKKNAEMAGRFRRHLQKRHAEKTRHGTEAITAIERTGNISRLLPSELARFRRPEQRLLFLKDLSERKTMGYRLEGKEPKGRGPIIMCCDESGSMHGAPHMWAKALALSLLWQARKENRAFAFVHFSTRVEAELFLAGSQPSFHRLTNMCSTFLGGGTDFDKPLEKAMNLLDHIGLQKGDLIFITDGCAPVSEEIVSRFKNQKKKQQFAAFGIGLGTWANPSTGVFELFDETYIINDFNDPEGSDRLFADLEGDKK